jgi:hypothetical protein
MKCEYCGKEFNTYRKTRRFCSVICYRKSIGSKWLNKKNPEGRGTEGICLYCNNKFIRKRDYQEYCSRRCSSRDAYKKGKLNGKEITKKAHEQVRQNALKRFKEKPNIYIGKRGYKIINLPLISKEAKRFGKTKMLLHHYIFYKHHNITKIPEGYHIHHIDGNCLNNELDNLQLIEAGEHTKLHYKIRTDKEKSNQKQ